MNNIPSPKKASTCTLFAFLALLAVSSAPSSFGADVTWNGPGSDFNSAGNWLGGAPDATTVANFAGATPTDVDVSAAITALGMNFTSVGYIIGSANSSILSVGASGIAASDSLGTIALSAPITYTGVSSVSNIGAGTTVDISGAFKLTGGAAVTFEKSGEGTLTLSGTNEGSAFGSASPTAASPAAGTKILVSNGVLNLNKTVTSPLLGNGVYYATSGDGIINVQKADQFGNTAFRPSFRLAGTGSINFSSTLGVAVSLAGLSGSGAYALSFGTDVDGNSASGGGALSIGGSTSVNVEDIRYQGTTAANITGSGTLSLRNSASLHRVIDVSDGSGTYKELTIGTLIVHSGATTLSLQKEGSGTLVITSNNVSGFNINLFEVNAGTLLANNTANSAVGTTGVSVAAGATLGGTGHIAPGLDESVTFAAGGRLSPGDINEATGATEVESLSFTFAGTGKLDLTAGALYTFDLGANTTAGTTYDTINVTGELAFLVATLQFSDFTFNQRTGFGAGQYTLFSATTLSGATGFSDSGSLGGGYTGTLSVVGNDLVLSVAVPEPATWALIALGLTAVVVLRKRRTTSVGR